MLRGLAATYARTYATAKFTSGMPRSVTRVCGHPGCPNLMPCMAHKPVAWRGSDRRQRLPGNWEALRRYVLARDPICKVCDVAPSTDADHIINNDDHHPGNLQGLCHPCHMSKTGRGQ